jgi:NitT/TauT family transport system substrate-binding protein
MIRMPFPRRAGTALAALGLVGASLMAGCGSTTGSATASPSHSAAASTGSGSLTHITVGYQPDLHGAAPVLIAQQQGFFKKEGLDVTLVRFTAGPALFTALQSGSLDSGYEGPGVTPQVIKGGGKIITVDSLNFGDEVVANPGITSVTQLVGKKVAVVLGTSAQMILDLALKKAGISPTAVDQVNATPAEAAAAYSSHKVPALALWIPPIVSAVQAVPGTNVLVTDRNFTPQYEFPQYWITSSAFLKAHPNTVVKFLKAWILADDWRMQHFKQDVQLVSQVTGVPASSLTPQVKATQWLSGAQLGQIYQKGSELKWFKGLETFFVQDGLLPKVVDPRQFVDTAPFMQALRSLSGQ